MCEDLVKEIKESNSDIVICGYKRLDRGKLIYKKSINKKIANLIDFRDDFDFLFENALFNPPWNKLYRRNKIKSEFSEKTSIGEDLLFNLNYFSNIKKIVLIDFCPYNYVFSEGQSISSKYSDELFNTQLLLDDAVRNFCIKCFGQTYPKNSIDRVFAKEIYYLLKRLVILDNTHIVNRLQKIKKIITDKRVKKMANCKDTFDKPIKIINFFIRNGWSFSIYVFFYLKKVVMK